MYIKFPKSNEPRITKNKPYKVVDVAEPNDGFRWFLLSDNLGSAFYVKKPIDGETDLFKVVEEA